MDNKLRWNLLLNIGYNILSVIVPFITAPYLGRVLGAEQVGVYTYVHSIAIYFSYFSMLGLMNYGSREIARVRDDAENRNVTFSKIYSMQIFTSTIVIVAYLTFSVFSKSEYRLYFFLMVMWVVSNIFDVGWYCTGMEQFKAVVLMGAISKLLNIALIFCIVHTAEDLEKYIAIVSFGQLIAHIFIWIIVKRQTTFTLQNLNSIKECIMPNLMLFIPLIAASIYNIMDKVMIGAIASKSDLAYYEYADKLVQIPSLFFSAIGTVLLSRMSNLLVKNSDQGYQLIGISMDLSLVIASAAAFGLAAISEELVIVYYGAQFQPSGRILLLLSPVIFSYAWANVLRMQYIIPQGKDSVYIKATIAGAAVNLIMNMIFIPYFGAVGATFGTLVAQATVAVVFTIYCHGHLPMKKFIFTNVPCALIGLMMFGGIKLIQLTHSISLHGLIIDVISGAILFAVLSALYGCFAQEHLLGIAISKVRKKV